MEKQAKTKKQKIKNIIVGILVFYGVFGLTFGLVGNPISRMLCEITSRKYIEENYPDYEIVSPLFFSVSAGGRYTVKIHKPGSEDLEFVIYFNQFGFLSRDEYISEQEYHTRTANRIFYEYQAELDKAMENSDVKNEFKYMTSNMRLEGWTEGPPYVPENMLIPDKVYDYKDLGYKYGEINIIVESSDISPAHRADIILKTKEQLNKSGMGFYTADLMIKEPYEENKEQNTLWVKNLKYDDIYSEGLEERIAALDAK